MKTLLNLKGLCRSSQLAVNPDSQPTVNRRSRLMSIICLFLLTLGVGQMWGGNVVYYVSTTNSAPKIHHWKNGTESNWDSRLPMSDAGTKTIDNTTYYLFSYDINTCEKFKIGDSGADLDWEPKAPYTDGTDRYISVNHFHAFRSSNITVASGCYVYFDNSNAQWSDAHILFCEGHKTHSTNYSMSHLTNTNLWYISPNANYNDAKYVGMMGNASSFSGNSWSVWNIKDATHYSDVLRYGMNSSRTYLISKANADNAGEISIDCDASHGNNGYSMLNHNQTIHVMLSNDNGSSYTEITSQATWPGTIKATRTYINGNGSSATESAETLSKDAYAKSAALTSSFSVTESGTATGYTFMGWGESADATPDGQATKTISSVAGANDLYVFFKSIQSTLTFDMESGSGGPANRTIYYGTALAGITGSDFPTKADNGFDGFWTEDNGNGIQVIKEDGTVKSGVENYTDASGNWIRTSNTTLYARWMPVGYYVAGKFNNWVADPAYHKFDPSTLKASFGLLKKTFEDKDYKTQIKIRKVNAGSSSGPSNTWYGKGASDGAITMGKDNPKETGLSTAGSNIALEVNYDGTYEFTITEGSGVIDLEVAVPVVNRLEIYNINGATSGTVDGHTLPWLTDDWEDAGVANTVTKTIQLERGKYYDFKPVYDSYYYGKTPTANITYNATPSSVSDLVDKQNNLHITADLKGDYKFDFNTSSKTLTVTYPTRRQINYEAVTLRSGNGTASGANGSLSAENDSDGDYAVSTDGYVADGNSVTFRAPAAATGYTWRGWFTKSDPSSWDDGKVSTDDELTYTVAVTGGNKTVYAIYSEDTHSLAVDSTSNYTASSQYGGHVEYNSTKVTSAIANVGVSSYAELTAVPANDAWHFKEWRFSANATLAAGYTANSNPVRVNASADGQTVTAFFEPRFALNGSLASDDKAGHGMPGWEFADASDFEVKSFTGLGNNGVCLQCTCTLDPNATYKFRVLDRDINNRRGCSASSEPDNILQAGDNWQLNHTEGNGAHDVRIKTVGRGTYIFHITNLSNDGNEYPSIQVERQASHLVSIGQGYVDVDGTIHSNSNTGGTMSATATESGTTVSITDGQYIAAGGNLAWTVDPAEGYHLDHYYGQSDFTGDGFDFTAINSIGAAPNVYAKFVENKATVTITANDPSKGTVTVGGEEFAWGSTVNVGVTTTKSLSVTAAAGYYFAGWERSGTLDFNVDDASAATSEAAKETTLRGLGTTNETEGTLTARFEELDKIYFRNVNAETGNSLWGSDGNRVWVYFNAYWDTSSDNKGAGGKDRPSAEMSNIAGTNIYWAYVPRGVTYNNQTTVAFSSRDWRNYNNFSGGGFAAYRSDYNRILNMFVPHHDQTNNLYSVSYNNNGYWMKYDTKAGEGAGYYWQRFTTSPNAYTQVAEMVATSDKATTLKFTVTIDDITAVNNHYMITSAGGLKYWPKTAGGAVETITSSNCTNLNLFEDTGTWPAFVFTPTIKGDYTFTLDQTGDVMKFSVEYPETPTNGYRLKHTYNDGSAKTTYSNIISATDAASGANTVSMFLSNGGTETLVLQKCTGVDGSGNLEWSTGNSDNLPAALAAGSTPGVYVFDITIDPSTDKVTAATEPSAYTGDYYIHVNATTRNNLNNGDPKSGSAVGNKFTKFLTNTTFGDTYDHYWVDWFIGTSDGGGAQVVAATIGNGINDDLAGKVGVGESTTTDGANVRYGYNSLTNDFTYAMIEGDGASIKIEGKEADRVKIYNGSSYEDSYNNPRPATDADNWMYKFEAKVKLGSQATITTRYNGTLETLAEDKTLLGNAASPTEDEFGVEVTYDFKTNRLIAAWKPDPEEEINKAIDLYSNLMVVRTENANPTLLNLTGDGALNNITQVYTVMEFTKANWDAADRTITSSGYTDAYYWISLPYDCKVSDIFGIEGYGSDGYWVIQTYHGDYRARDGWWAETESWWYDLDRTDMMKANQGYVLRLTNLESTGAPFTRTGVNTLRLYFPSSNAANINIGLLTGEVSYTLDPMHCDKWRGTNAGDPRYDRRAIDSNWRIIGSPSFNTATISDPTFTTGSYPANQTGYALKYFYTWSVSANVPVYTITSTSNFEFKATHAYLVQYEGKIVWSEVTSNPLVGVKAAPAHNNEEQGDQTLKMVLSKGSEQADVTYISRMAEGATEGYDLNLDLSKLLSNSGNNLYTLAGYYKMAGNCLPETTTTVPVGVQIAAEGEYTFSMPEGTNGVGAVLIDNIAGTRTNLALTDYTVQLPAGQTDNRFVLELSPISNVATGIENVQGDNVQGTNAQKRIVDGVLYIVKNGQVFDARGNKVK